MVRLPSARHWWPHHDCADGGHEAHEGFAAVAMFTVMLSLQLGIINLLPVPLLDGGHLLFFACEGLRGKPLKLRHREMALQVGLLLLSR